MSELAQLPERLTAVEVRLTGVEDRLTGVEGRLTGVEGQILQLREEMHGEFSAVRTEMRTLHGAALEAIKAGDEETRVFMRVLFEKHESDERLIDEGRKRKRKR